MIIEFGYKSGNLFGVVGFENPCRRLGVVKLAVLIEEEPFEIEVDDYSAVVAVAKPVKGRVSV